MCTGYENTLTHSEYIFVDCFVLNNLIARTAEQLHRAHIDICVQRYCIYSVVWQTRGNKFLRFFSIWKQLYIWHVCTLLLLKTVEKSLHSKVGTFYVNKRPMRLPLDTNDTVVENLNIKFSHTNRDKRTIHIHIRINYTHRFTSDMPDRDRWEMKIIALAFEYNFIRG